MTSWVARNTKQYNDSNVIFVGAFQRGRFAALRGKYSDAYNYPHLHDINGLLMKKICNMSSTGSMVVIGPDGKIAGSGRSVDAIISGKVTHPYKELVNAPAVFKGLVNLLKWGHFGEASQMIGPYLNSKSEDTKVFAHKALELIQVFEKNLLKKVKNLIEAGDIAEAYRLASKVLYEYRGIRSDFTKELKSIVAQYSSDKKVRALKSAARMYTAGLNALKQGKIEIARKYFDVLAEKYSDNYYGKKANLLSRSI